MHIHLDALGGVAGDMYAAALLDAFPEHLGGVLASIEAATAAVPVTCRLAPHNDGILCGHRFLVELADVRARSGHAPRPHRHGTDEPAMHQDGHMDPAGHRSWARIRTDLCRAGLLPAVRDHALAIFAHLAQAEARVHGMDVERVTFHEVGAWDSLADIVAAAHLIAALGASRWSVGPLPLGSGRVTTAHGPLPVPAPATALLLQGFTVVDDGIAGERVTPTGAAILRHICGGQAAEPVTTIRRLGRSGVGFGAKLLPNISNCLRVMVYDEAAAVSAASHRELAVIEFEVDDQSAEDLATGLDRLRAHDEIFDVVQMPVFGKKGRMMTHVRALARADGLAAAVEACFRETTTIGLRHRLVGGATLPRQQATVEVGGLPVRVKTVERPGGRTAKAEADDARAQDTHAARAELRREAERRALAAAGKTGGRA